MTRGILFAIVALALFACFGNEGNGNTSSTCSIDAKGNSLLFNFTSDFIAGELRWMSPDSTKYSPGALSLGQNTYISAIGENLFALTRNPGTLTCIKAKDICNEKAIKQVGLSDANPYEVVVIDNKGYMILWDAHYIQVFDPSECTLIEKIHLPELLKNPSSIKASGDTLLISMQRLEWDNLGMSPKTPSGLLVLINANTGTLIDTISLKLYNPHKTILSKGKLYISQNGLWDLDMNILRDENGLIMGAGLEVVDLATRTTEILITGSELGGGVQGIALDEKEQIMYMLVYSEWKNTPVVPFDLETKIAGNPLQSIKDAFGDLIFDEVKRKLFIGERDLDNFGLKIYDPATKTIIPVRDDKKYSLPPYSQAIARW
jgi:hypothetical protein